MPKEQEKHWNCEPSRLRHPAGSKDLLQSVIANELQKVLLLLSNGANANTRNNEGETVLFSACERGYSDMVHALLSHGAHIKANPCPLVAAARNGYTACVKLMLLIGVPSNSSGRALRAAWDNKQFEVVELLLEHGTRIGSLFTGQPVDFKHFFETANYQHASLVEHLFRSQLYLRPLAVPAARTYAFTYGLHDTALHLLGLQPGAESQDTKTLALYFSAKNNWPDVVMNLLMNRADGSRALQGKGTPMYIASQEGHENIVNILFQFHCNPNICIDNDEKSLPLYAATCSGHRNIVAALINYGAVLSPKDCHRPSPVVTKSKVLRLAFEHGQVGIVEMFVMHDKKNPHINQVLTELMVTSIQTLCLKDVEFLIRLGTNLRYFNQRNETLLHLACSVKEKLCINGSGDKLHHCTQLSCCKALISIVTLLLNCGVNINAVCDAGDTALCRACDHGHYNVVHILLNARRQHAGNFGTSKINKYNSASKTSVSNCAHLKCRSPLCVAVYRGYDKIVKLLVEHGENINVIDCQGSGAVHIALRNVSTVQHECWNQNTSSSDYEAILTTLLQNGAFVNVVDGQGETPLYIAVNRQLDKMCHDLLFCFGACPNIGQPNKMPLVAACDKNDTVLAKLLLEHNAKPDGGTTSCEQLNSLCIDFTSVVKVRSSDATCYKSIHDNTSPDDEKHLGQEIVDRYEIEKCLLPLCIAAKNGYIELLELLLTYNATVNLCDNEGLYPLHRAIQFLYNFTDWNMALLESDTVDRMTTCVRKLLNVQADPNCVSRYGLAPMHYALSILVNLRLSMIPSLLIHVYYSGQFVTMRSAVMAIVRLLIDHGASLVDAHCNIGEQTETPFQLIHLLTVVNATSGSFLTWLLQAGIGRKLLSLFCRLLTETSGGSVTSDLCKAAVLAGCPVSSSDIRDVEQLDDAGLEMMASLKNDLVMWLQTERSRPPRLARLCCNAVRMELSRCCDHANIIPLIDAMEIPEQYKQFLKFESPLSEVDLSNVSFDRNRIDESTLNAVIPAPVELALFKFDRVFCRIDSDEAMFDY